MNRETRGGGFEKWIADLPRVKANKGPARGTIAGAMVVLERLKKSFDLDIAKHVSPKGTQVTGASGRAIKALLAKFDEQRVYISEGGRTNRGLRDDIEKLLFAVEGLRLGSLSESSRSEKLTALQRLLLVQVQAFLNMERLELEYQENESTQQHIATLLETARTAGKDGAVAQHLVGAKLALRFPGLEIENNSSTTADIQLDRVGDFLVGDTAFHVTVAPGTAVFDKCRANLAAGHRAAVIVPARKLEASRQLAGDELLPRLSLFTLESFVSQNIDELGAFCAAARANDLARLIVTYNQRVAAAEHDKSLLIEPPRNLPSPT